MNVLAENVFSLEDCCGFQQVCMNACLKYSSATYWALDIWGHLSTISNYNTRDIDSSHKAWMKWMKWIVVCVLLSGEISTWKTSADWGFVNAWHPHQNATIQFTCPKSTWGRLSCINLNSTTIWSLYYDWKTIGNWTPTDKKINMLKLSCHQKKAFRKVCQSTVVSFLHHHLIAKSWASFASCATTVNAKLPKLAVEHIKLNLWSCNQVLVNTL